MKRFNLHSLFSVALAMMLVFSVGFYTCLEPTTAWFTSSGDKNQSFDMDEIVIEYSDGASSQVSLNFQASTIFSDENERSEMFEYTVQFFTFTAKNTGGRDAYVTIDAVDKGAATKNYETKGLQFFAYEYTSTTPYTTGVTEYVDGIFVNADGDRVISDGTNYFRTNPTFVSALETQITALGATYNNLAAAADRTAFINACKTHKISVAAGETKKICVAFWVDYDLFIANAPISGLRNVNYDIQLQVNAVQKDHNT